MEETPGKDRKATGRLTTATNVLVILVALIVLFDSHGPIRTQWRAWLEQYQDRRTAVETWPAVTARFSPEGDEEALPVVAVEFTDYQCPFCRRMEIVKQQIEMPDVRIATRHLPLDQIHPNASLAAKISICTEAFAPSDWPDVDALLYHISDSLDAVDWPARLEAAGITNVSEVDRCVRSEMPRERLEEDRHYAELYRINGTPSYVFPRHVHRGAVEAEIWAEFLNSARTELSVVREGERR